MIDCLVCNWRGYRHEMTETPEGHGICPRCAVKVATEMHDRAGELMTFAAAATCFNTDEFMVAMWRRIHALGEAMGEPVQVPWFAQRWAAQARDEARDAAVIRQAVNG